MPPAIERVLVAGATGDTGREVLAHLQGTDVTVRATTRSATRDRELEQRGADEIVVGDLFQPADAVRVVEDCDAVLCTVGTPIGPRHFLAGRLVDWDGVSNLLTAAIAEGVEQFVYESAIGVGSSRSGLPAPLRLPIWRSLRAKRRSENALRSSELTHTILRPGLLTNGPETGDVVVGQGGDTVTGSIARADVARCMVASLFTPAARDQTFEIVSRNGLRGDASGVLDVDWGFPEAVAE